MSYGVTLWGPRRGLGFDADGSGSGVGFDASGTGSGMGRMPCGVGRAAAPQSKLYGVSSVSTAPRPTVLQRMTAILSPERMQPGVGNIGLAPALVIGAAKMASGLIKKSAAGPNRDAAAQVWPLAQNGQLAAVQAFLSRATLQTTSSAAPWKAGADALRNNADLMAQTTAAVQAGRIPAAWWALPPEGVLPAVQAYGAVRYTGQGGDGVTQVAMPPDLQASTSLVPTILDLALQTPQGQDIARQAAAAAARNQVARVQANVTPLLIGAAVAGAVMLMTRGGGGRVRTNPHRRRRRRR